MDFKLMRNSIIIGILVVITICGFVYYMNMNQQADGGLVSNSTSETTASISATTAVSDQTVDYRAFMQDDMFFDKEDDSTSQDIAVSKNSVTMVVTTVEKDIRVQIQNVLGKLVTGENFDITIENVGDFTDDDGDGLIYVDGLAAGNYNIILNPMDGYQVPQSSLQVNVKDKVAYEPIGDIGLFVEKEIASATLTEDTQVQDAKEVLSDSDKTKIIAEKDVNADGVGTLGIDVSKWNGDIDWKAVKEAGISFAIIRCGYRALETGAIVEDPKFEENIEAANLAGIHVGVEFFSQALNEVEAVEEASAVLYLCDGYLIDYPIFINVGSAGGNGRADSLDTETRTTVVKAFLETIAGQGYTAGVYASSGWYEDKLNTSELGKNTIWVAEFAKKPTYKGPFNIWQYTSNGTVDGIEGNVDMDLNYSDYE